MSRIRLLSIMRFFRNRPLSSDGKVIYALPDHNIHSKFYNKDTEFKDVNWECMNSVVDGFQMRFISWYFDFLKGGDQSYIDFCSLCVLIDIFTHYDRDCEWHDQKHYKDFLRCLNPIFRRRLISPITTSRFRSRSWQLTQLKDIADVFYTGVRCSLHHHGDLAAFTGMRRTGEMVKEFPNAGSSVCGNYTYSLIIFDPEELKIALIDWFTKYCDDLKRNPMSRRAMSFRRRFREDFGITIP